ncbi:C-type lectin mannose-binding isoform-like [Synchiropus picturatus]
MFRLLLLLLSLYGLQAAPIAAPKTSQEKPPTVQLPDGFRQGTENSHILGPQIPEDFRQGTEPSRRFIVDQSTGLVKEHVSEMERGADTVQPAFGNGFGEMERRHWLADGVTDDVPVQKLTGGWIRGTEPSTKCEGLVINGNCYEFNPTPLAFRDAQDRCRALAPKAELTSVSSRDLHSRLVSLVNLQSGNRPSQTWLGGTVKNQQASWVDGSEWTYSDWMPGQPNIHTDKPVCVEMFHIDESWWTAADCELERASICSYPVSL